MMLQAPKKRDADSLWDAMNDVDNEAYGIRVIENMLFELINEHSVNEPFTDQDHERMCWLVNQLGEANTRLNKTIRKAFGEH